VKPIKPVTPPMHCKGMDGKSSEPPKKGDDKGKSNGARDDHGHDTGSDKSHSHDAHCQHTHESAKSGHEATGHDHSSMSHTGHGGKH
jgi:hypothetical protein